MFYFIIKYFTATIKLKQNRIYLLSGPVGVVAADVVEVVVVLGEPLIGANTFFLFSKR